MSQNHNHQALDIALHWQHDGVFFNDWMHIADYRHSYDRFLIDAEQHLPLDHVQHLKADKILPAINSLLKDKNLRMTVSPRKQDHDDTLKLYQDRQRLDIDTLLFGQGIGAQMNFTNFNNETFNTSAMSRQDESEDHEYFSIPDLHPYWPLEESGFVSNIYDRELQRDHQVLDLMAGIHSPLIEASTKVGYLACAGLNKKELERNPLCNHRVTLNVNTVKELPFQSVSFDAILLHAAIEYVTKPQVLFAEIRRVLRPGGKIIISFNHRTEPQKAIRLWRETMDFDHIAIVTYYLRQYAHCQNITATSHRLVEPQQTGLETAANPTCIVCGQ